MLKALWVLISFVLFVATMSGGAASAQATADPSTGLGTDKKPNILVIWGDDIGYWNVSAYNQGMMGYKTPNIDRIAKEGALFTDWYGEQSCTAGRSAFITGQSGFRTGNLKVGLPGAKEGLQARDVTLAQLLKAQGYMTAQFGKNHLGDRRRAPCRRRTALTSSWARCTTSTPRKNSKTRITSKIRP